jgi:pimeloyl-ACP methyl ester carboxylesterase
MTTRENTVTANGVSFAVLESGPPDGPLALCLHGYPDTAWTWRHLMPELADDGWRAVAPFMRGYAPTSLPSDGRYQTGALVADANGLHEALGGTDQAALIGHDWGAVAAYGAASHQPERWQRVVTLAIPPAPVMAAAFTNVEQLKLSWYMFFQCTALAEQVIPLEDFSFLRALWNDWSPGYDASEDLERVAEALAEPSRLLAALGYYRAQFGMAELDPALAAEQQAVAMTPPQPTLYLHGSTDGCVGAVYASSAPGFLSRESEVEVIEDAGHWLHLEQPPEVNRRVVEFVGAGAGR